MWTLGGLWNLARIAALALMFGGAGIAHSDEGNSVNGFAMLNSTVGIVVTGLEDLPHPTASAIVGGFVSTINEQSGGEGGAADLLNAGRVLVVRGYASSVGGAAPGLVIDWRVSIDGGVDVGAIFLAIEHDGPGWQGVDSETATRIGRSAGEKFLDAHFTTAFKRSSGEGALLLD